MNTNLPNNEAIHRKLLEAIPDLIFRVSSDGQTVAVVSAGREMTSSIPPEDVPGTNAYDALPFEVAQERTALIKAACQFGQAQSHEYQLYLNQQLHFEEARIVPVSSDEAIVIIRDITKQKQMTQAVQESERQLRRQNQVLSELAKSKALGRGHLEPALKEIAEIAAETLTVERVNIWLYNETHSTIQCLEHYDRSTESHTKGGEIEVASHPLYFKALEEERMLAIQDVHTDSRTQELLAVYLQPNQITALLDASIRLRGQVVGVLCQEHLGAPRRWSLEEQHFAGSLADFVSLALEASERNRAETALKLHLEQLEEMIQERTQSLQEAQERLIRQEKLAFLGQLAGGVGHELRNPLGVIANAVYFLQMVLAGADGTVKEYLDLIASRVREAEKIVSDLLNLSRNRANDRAGVSIHPMIDEVLARHPAPERVTIITDLPSSLPALFVDLQQIKQVLANLITNAYQAMPQGGELTITAQAEGEWVRLLVADTGHGMAPETMAKIFEPLYTTKTRGVGLGLAVSKNLVEVNEGTLTVESSEDQGATFILTLPALMA
jgi:signal transduction histidine kinase